MTLVSNEPIVRAYIKKEQTIRAEKRVHLTPGGDLDTVDQLVIDMALNDIMPENTVLPLEYEKNLMLSTSRYYQVSNTVSSPVFDRTIMVNFDTSASKINIYIYNKSTDVITLKQFRVLVTETSSRFITADMSKSEYLTKAVHLVKNKVFQFRADLDEAALLLSHVVFQVDLIDYTPSPLIESKLVELLSATEVTLHLNITTTVKLYGGIDQEKFLNLYIREIGTPDTYWTRSVLLTELLDSFN